MPIFMLQEFPTDVSRALQRGAEGLAEDPSVVLLVQASDKEGRLLAALPNVPVTDEGVVVHEGRVAALLERLVLFLDS